ncbi:hypothetical protein FVEN_g7016 [Fusarium venenatum]|nr:hypothetical protein FVEN_g7016 [Fusarium venenatum]
MTQVAEGVCMICAIQLWELSPSYSPTHTNENTPPDWNPFKWREDNILLSGPTWPAEGKGPTSTAIPEENVTVQKAHIYNRSQATISSTGLKWNHNPLDIPHLTEALVSNLERVEPSSTHKQFNTSLNNLPPEIEETITSFLIEGCISLECTYLMPQSRWKDIIFQIPFLRDLEKDIIEAKEQEAVSGSFEWNWEKLVRQVLSEVPIFVSNDDDELENPWSYQTFGLTVPMGFTNRRRIWQILVDMYPNDVGMVHCLDEEDEDQDYDQDEET